MSSSSISDYTLVQSAQKELNLFVDSDNDTFEQAKSSILDLLKGNKISDVAIHRAETRHHEKGNKLRRIRNDYWKAN